MVDCLAQPEYRGACLVLRQLDMPYFANRHGRPVPFEQKQRRDALRWGRGSGEERREAAVKM